MTTATETPVSAPPEPEQRPAALPPPPIADAAQPSVPSAGVAQRPPPLAPRLAMVRAVLLAALALTASTLVQFTFVSALQQRSEQQRLYDSFRAQLAEGTAPVGPTDVDGDAYPIGAPVAYLDIPTIGVRQVVVSGTSSGALFAGPGHRRDTVLPGQAGATVILGRRAAYGGPFSDLDQLEKGDRITVTTGQGEFDYIVDGVRFEGDRLPPPIERGEGRLVLTTADGPPFLPTGVLRVDATMEGTPSSGTRLLASESLPPSEDAMAGDTSQIWALALWLQALVLVALAAVWSWHRWGRAQTWVVMVPPLLLVGIFSSNHAARLLPNLL